MKKPFSNRARLPGCASLITLAMWLAAPAHAGGPQGVDGGWVINNSGGINLTPTLASQYVAAKTGWIRVNMRLIPGHTNWDSTILGYYDTAINNARNAGLQVLILMGGEAWNGGQSSWNANNYECNGGNGDNAYIDSFVTGAFAPIIAHFHDRVKAYEIWNEPSTWTSQSGGCTSGGTYMYPSCFGCLMNKCWINGHQTQGFSDVKIISGGIFGTSSQGASDPYGNSGASWLNAVYSLNTSTLNWFSSCKSTYGSYPLDGIGQHIYIDQWTTTTASNFQSYEDEIRNVYTKYEGSGTSKKTYITEFGWNTSNVSYSVQDQNLVTAFSVIEASGSYVALASWFTWQDGGAGNWGILDSSGNQKPSYNDYKFYQQYEGYYINGTINNNILNYFNGRGQAILGDAFDNGGTAFVHTWGGANVQDFDGGSDKGNTVFDSSWGTFHVDDTHGLWTYYQKNGGVGKFGLPQNDDHSVSAGIRQDFAATTSSPGGDLFWNSSDGSISWNPNQATLFYTSFETSQTQPTWKDTIDWSLNVSGYNSTINPECSTRKEQARSGTTALMYSGTDNSSSSSYCYVKVFSVNIPITSATKMSYWIYPQQTNGMYVAVDYHCTDGTTLRDSGAVDYNGYRMHPNAGHGGNLPLSAWSDIECNVGQWLAGKTVDKIWVAYDQPPRTGQFRGYIDDIKITNGTLP